MDTLLKIASCVEAAVEAYGSVKPVSNLDVWRRHFEEEKVSAVSLIRHTLIEPESELGQGSTSV